MSAIFSRFSFHAAKFDGQVWLCLGAIWLIVLSCTIASIFTQRFSTRQRRFWILVVCLAPVAGTLVYLPFSCRWESLAQLFFIRLHRKQDKKGGPNAGRLDGEQEH